MPSKREHTKSRLGCAQCKQRRIKCDEIAPRCGPCSKKGLDCEYKELEGVQNSIHILTQANFETFSSSSRSAEAGSSSSRRSNSQGSARSHDGISSFSTHDLFLMHHYTRETSHTLAVHDEEAYHQVWQTIVPTLAAQFPFLMHAVLSVTAAHRGMFDVARDHYGRAIAAFTTSGEAATTEQADATLCYCLLIMIITVALECTFAPADADPLHGILDFFAVTRTTIPMLSSMSASVQSRPIGGLLQHMNEVPSGFPIAADLDYSLRTVAHRLEGHLPAASQQPDEDHAALTHALHVLRYFFTLAPAQPHSRLYMLRWMMAISPTYLALLRGHDPAAMVILAHWCVPSSQAPPRWFAAGWPQRVVGAIAREVNGTGWEECMAWPVANVQQPGDPSSMMWTAGGEDLDTAAFSSQFQF